MKQKQKTLFILLAALLLLLAAWLLLRRPAEEESPALLSIPCVQSGDAVSLEWSNAGETVSLSQKDGVWQWDGDTDFPVDQDAAARLAAAAENLVPSAAIPAEDAGELSDYGLTAPVRSVTVTAADGERCAYRVGGASPISSDEVYVSLDGEEDVWLLPASFSEAFSVGLYDLLQKEEIPVFTNVSSLTVETPAQTLALTRAVKAGDESDEEADSPVWEGTLDGEAIEVDTARADDLLQTVTTLTWGECVHYKADDALLEECGLATPACVVTVVFEGANGAERVFSLEVGSGAGSYAYARLSGSRMVYLVDLAVRDALTDLSAAEA